MRNPPTLHREEPRLVEPEIIGFEDPPSFWRRLLNRLALGMTLVIVGGLMLVVGAALTISLIGAPVGIPLVLLSIPVLIMAVFLLAGGGSVDVRRYP